MITKDKVNLSIALVIDQGFLFPVQNYLAVLFLNEE